MKLSDAKTTRVPKPFLDVPNLKVTTREDELGHIIGWDLTHKGKTTKFTVKKSKITKCWLEVEKYIAKLK